MNRVRTKEVDYEARQEISFQDSTVRLVGRQCGSCRGRKCIIRGERGTGRMMISREFRREIKWGEMLKRRGLGKVDMEEGNKGIRG